MSNNMMYGALGQHLKRETNPTQTVSACSHKRTHVACVSQFKYACTAVRAREHTRAPSVRAHRVYV